MIHAAFVENRFKKSQATSSHQPSASSQHPATNILHQAANPLRLLLQPSGDANKGTAQIPMGVAVCTQPGLAEYAEQVNSAASAKVAWRIYIIMRFQPVPCQFLENLPLLTRPVASAYSTGPTRGQHDEHKWQRPIHQGDP